MLRSHGLGACRGPGLLGLLAANVAKNPNPSGTARVMTVFNLLSTAPNFAVAKLMYSPRGVRLLSRAVGQGDVGELTKTLGRLAATQGAKGGGN